MLDIGTLMKEGYVLQEGDRAPGFSLPQVGGEAVSLGTALASNERVLLVFLRYLG